MDAQHMNQQTFANATGIGSASLSSIFTGRTRPTLNHVDAILDKFPNVNPLWLLKGQGGMFLMADDSNVMHSGGDDAQSGNASGTSSASQYGGLFATDNLSVEPNLFNSHNNPSPSTSAGTPHTRNQQMSFHPITQQRKITEIRIFYDDQTWETFVPKNK